MTDKPGGDELRLPQGLSPAEEADWWEEHRDFWDADDTEYELRRAKRQKPKLRVAEDRPDQ